MADRIIALAEETAVLLSHASYRENAYQTVFAHLLRQHNFKVRSEVGVVYRLPSGFQFGAGRMDLLVEEKDTKEVFILELKANVRYNGRAHLGQLARYQHHWVTPSYRPPLLFSGMGQDVSAFPVGPVLGASCRGNVYSVQDEPCALPDASNIHGCTRYICSCAICATYGPLS